MNRFNHEKYDDPTAYSALKKISDTEKRLDNLVRTLKFIISLSGFELMNRFELMDKESGRVYK